MQRETTEEEERDERKGLLREIYEKYPDDFHAVFDSSSEESSRPDSDSNESEGMGFPDLQVILDMIDARSSSNTELSEAEQHQKELPPPEPPPTFRDPLPPITEEPRKAFVFGATRLPSPQAQPQPVPASPSPGKEESRSWVQRAEAARLEANESISNMPQPQPAPTSPNLDKEDGRTWSQWAEAARLEAKESIQRSRAQFVSLPMQLAGPLVAEIQPTGRFIFGVANKEG